MSNTAQVEPTEDQKQAAQAFCACHEEPHEVTDSGVVLGLEWSPTYTVDDIARLLAEREAKLREDVDANIRLRVAAEERTRLLQGLANTARAEADTLQARLREWRGLVDMHMNDANTLRARVAELEAKIADAVFSCPGCGRHDFGFFASQIKAACGPCRTRAEAAEEREAQHLARIAELEAEVSESTRLRMTETLHGMGVEAMYQEREAQHLAGIKAAKDALKRARPHAEAIHIVQYGVVEELSTLEVIDEVLARLAHYDDAKADAGAVCTHSARVWNVIDQTMRCRVCDDAKAAEGGEG